MNPDEKREFHKSLRERIKQLRMDHLFDNRIFSLLVSNTYEPEWEEDYFWDCRLTYDHEDEDA